INSDGTVNQIESGNTVVPSMIAVALDVETGTVYSGSQSHMIVMLDGESGTLPSFLHDNRSFVIDGDGTMSWAPTTLPAVQGVGVASLTLTNGGTTCPDTTTVSLTGGGGSGAVAQLSFTGSSIANLQLTTAGFGYTSAPTVT